MKKDILYNAIGEIDDDIIDTAINVNLASKKLRRKSWIKYSSAAACVCLLAAGFVLLPNIFKNETTPEQLSSNVAMDIKPDQLSSHEDYIAMDTKICFNDNEYYPLANTQLLLDYGIDSTVTEDQIGKKIGVVSEGSFTGNEVYSYAPINCDAIVLMKNGESYELYYFLAFNSYGNNQDEDMAEYLKMYGMSNFSEIEKITFDGISLEKSETEVFYNFFADLKDSSNDYFNSLSSYKEDKNSESEKNVSESNSTAYSSSGMQISQGNPGTNALNNSHSIKIYGTNGLWFEMFYYPNIEFISRHKVNDSFIEFLKDISNN